MSQLRTREAVRRQTLLEINRGIFARLSRTSSDWRCTLTHTATGEKVSTATGNTEDEAFRHAYNKLQRQPEKKSVEQENEALRQKIRDLESGVQGQSATGDKEAKDSDPAADSTGSSTVSKKKRGRPKKNKGPLDLPDVDNPETWPEAFEPQVKVD